MFLAIFVFFYSVFLQDSYFNFPPPKFYKNTHTHIYTRIYINIYTHAQIHTHTHTHTHAHTHTVSISIYPSPSDPTLPSYTYRPARSFVGSSLIEIIWVKESLHSTHEDRSLNHYHFNVCRVAAYQVKKYLQIFISFKINFFIFSSVNLFTFILLLLQCAFSTSFQPLFSCVFW